MDVGTAVAVKDPRHTTDQGTEAPLTILDVPVRNRRRTTGKVYVGTFTQKGWYRVHVEIARNGRAKPLVRPLRHLEIHSPDGFSWGYLGSGPTDLAAALLADATGDSYLAVEMHQLFKSDVVAKLGHPHTAAGDAADFRLPVEDVLRWVGENVDDDDRDEIEYQRKARSLKSLGVRRINGRLAGPARPRA
jgi:hypothetical protein